MRFAKYKGSRLYIRIGDRGAFWLPLHTPAYRSDDTHELIPVAKESKKLKKVGVYPHGRDVLLDPLKHVAEKKTDDNGFMLSCRHSDSLLHQLDESSNAGSFAQYSQAYL